MKPALLSHLVVSVVSGVASAIVMAVLLAPATAEASNGKLPQEAVKGSEFLLVTAEGIPVARLAVSRKGEPALLFPAGERSMDWIQLFVDDGKEPMMAFQAEGERLIELGLDRGKNGYESHLELSDTDGNLRAKLFVAPSGDPKLEFYSSDGKVVWKAP